MKNLITLLLIVLSIGCAKESDSSGSSCKSFHSDWSDGDMSLHLSDIEIGKAQEVRMTFDDAICFCMLSFDQNSDEDSGTIKLVLSQTGQAYACNYLVGSYTYTRTCETLHLCNDEECGDYK